MIKVVFTNGTEQFFKADAWNFRDAKNNNVWLIDDDEITVHLNWDQIRYMEKIFEEIDNERG